MTATDVVPERETSAQDGPHPAAAPARRRLLVALSALGLLLVVAAGVLVFLLLRYQSVEDRREDILRAATQTAINLTTLDSEDLQGDIDLVVDGATGTFRTDFEGRADELEQVLTENEVSSTGDVLETAIIRSDESTATALVVVDSTVKNTAAPEGRVNTYRMRLELERVGDSWKTSMLEFVA